MHVGPEDVGRTAACQCAWDEPALAGGRRARAPASRFDPMTRPRRRRRQTRAPRRSEPALPPRSHGLGLLGAVLALVVATLVAYAPALRAPFELDDVDAIVNNPTITRLSPLSAPLSPPAATPVAGRPFVNVTFAANYAINAAMGIDQSAGMRAPGVTTSYHVVNLALHVACGLLLLALLLRTLRGSATSERDRNIGDRLALVVVAIWMLHPLQTEAVDYITQRTELLVSLCYVATLYFAARAWDAGRDRASIAWCCAAVAACFLGMESKEVMITAPITVVLYDLAFHGDAMRQARGRRRRLVLYAALCATAIPLLVAVSKGARADSVGFGLGVTWSQYLYSQAWAVAHYLRLAVWPSRLTFDYGQRPIAGWRGMPGAVLLAGLLALSIYAWRRRPRLAFLGCTFFLLLAPSSSVVPVATEIAAERRIYLALAPVAVAAIVGVELLRRRLPAPGRLARPLVVVAAVALAAATFRRSRLYADPQALWRDAVANAPANPRAYDNLASTLFFLDPPPLDEAEALYSRAIALDSTYLHAWPGLASVAIDRGHFDTAEWILEHALTIDPNYSDAVDHLGRLLLREGKADKALPYLARFANAYPSDNSLVSLGTAYLQVGQLDSAASTLHAALELNPNRADALRFLGGLVAEQGRGADAIPLLERATSLEPESGIAVGLLSLAYAEAGRSDDAVRTARAAVSTSKESSVPVLAGRAMLALHRDDDARRFFNDALRLDPKNREAAARLAAMTPER